MIEWTVREVYGIGMVNERSVARLCSSIIELPGVVTEEDGEYSDDDIEEFSFED